MKNLLSVALVLSSLTSFGQYSNFDLFTKSHVIGTTNYNNKTMESMLDSMIASRPSLSSGFTASDFNIASRVVSIDYTNGQAASAVAKGFLTSADWTTFNNKVSTSVTISTTVPLTGGGDLSANRTFAINNAEADGSTKGASSYTASDFNGSSGLISIDYTNGQAASSVNKGFLTSADWTTFNGKQDALTPAALTRVDDTNVTLTLGGTPTTALLQATSLTLGWSGQLSAARGGTGTGTYAVGDLLSANTTTTLSRIAAVAAGSYLRSAGTSTLPVWSTLILPNAATVNRVVYATSTNTYGESANLTFNGSTFTVTGAGTFSSTLQTTAGGLFGARVGRNVIGGTVSGTILGNSEALFLSDGSTVMRSTAGDDISVYRGSNTITTGGTGQIIKMFDAAGTLTVNHTTATIYGFYYHPTVGGSQTPTEYAFFSTRGNATFTGGAVSAASFTASGLSADRGVVTSTSGLLAVGPYWNNSTGSLGIGSAPGANENIAVYASSAAAVNLKLNNASTGIVGIDIKRDGGTAAQWYLYVPDGSTNFRFYDGTADRFTFTTAGLFTAASVQATGQTATRVWFSGTSGLASDDGDFTYNSTTNTITVPGVTNSGTLSLTSGTNVLISASAGDINLAADFGDIAITDPGIDVLQSGVGYINIATASASSSPIAITTVNGQISIDANGSGRDLLLSADDRVDIVSGALTLRVVNGDLFLVGLQTTCAGAATGEIAAVAGVLTVCP